MSTRSKHPLFWFAGGALVATLLTLLFGTEKGKQTRQHVANWFRKL